MLLRHCCVITLSLLVSFCLNAQSSSFNNTWFSANAHHGRSIPEYQFINYIVNKPIYGGEFAIYKRTLGKTIWEKKYGYPEYGLRLAFSSLGNDEVLGKEWALFPYFQNTLVQWGKLRIIDQVGFGFSYVTKKYDAIKNYRNVAVGSHFNLHFNCKLGLQYLLSPKLIADAGLSFAHYSNANTAEPNLGINMASIYIGINYALGKQDERFVPQSIPHIIKNEMALVYAIGGRRTRALQRNYYMTSSLSVEYKYHWKLAFHPGIGADVFFDSSTEAEFRAPGKQAYQSKYDFRTGVHIAEEFVYDRFSFILQQGVYLGLKNQVNPTRQLYNRAIMRYKINHHILVCFSMKSHLHILDYPEIGFGYYFAK